MLFTLLALHIGVAAAAPMAHRRLDRGVFWLCALAPLATVAWAAAQAPAVLAGRPVVQTLRWAPALDLAVRLRLDAFALVMVLLVAGIGVLVFAYSASYFGQREPRVGRFAATLTVFAAAMLGLVLADNLLFLYVCWELTSITSYLLIGHGHEQGSTRAAALQALLVTSAGGLVMLAGFVLLGQAAGTFELSALLADPPRSPAAATGALLATVGAFTKSAQVPFHFWLPNAMAAPTPVSAYLHSATMVKAGVYLLARLSPAFAVAVPGWRPLVVGVGLATMLVGGYRALRNHDLKRLLAFGTVSQLGFLVVLFGFGEPALTHAGVALLVAHAAFKAALFLAVGVVDHAAGTRDLRRLSGLGRRLPALAAVTLAAGASMAGLPPLLGFVAKEAAFEALLHGGGDLADVALVGVVAGSVLTFAYTARLLLGGFGRKADEGTHDYAGPDAHRPSGAFVAPAALLAAASLVLGLAPELLTPLVSAAAGALVPGVEAEPLALWHGLTPALWLSLLVVALGAALSAGAGRVEALQARVGLRAGAQAAYEQALVGLNRLADRVTAVAQSGSLPVYLGVILATVVLLPGAALLRGGFPGLPPRVAESPLQAVAAAGVLVAALAMTRVRRRFTAVLLLGGVGYGVALLFVIQGAPDLALTQVLIETLSVVLFVLVLRHLPTHFHDTPWRLGESLRRLVAAGVGVLVFALALTAGAVEREPAVARAFLDRALPEAGGRNVVNVILVDFRGFDTLGEITVLVVAALGIAGLVLAGRRGVEADEA